MTSTPSNCPIFERTADGEAVGRCWFYTGNTAGVCPRHGDVREALKRLPELTDELVHRESSDSSR